MTKVILITGTRKGIGEALARHYLMLGNTVIGCSREEGSITHNSYRHFCLDITDESAVISMIRSLKKEFGRLDVLINNAGIASMNHFITTPLSTMEKLFRVNVLGTALMMRECAKVMMKQERGRIINFTTIATPLHLEGEAIYASAKAAIENLTQTTSKELSNYKITVNAIGPTPIQTDLIKAVPKEKIDALIEKQTLKRMGTFDDITHVVDFFVDEKSDFLTGQILYLGGVSR
ncbi:SDR family oxidoreductase [Sulfuricurvum sp.]|uniref:SDR family NAD(P)-dependent oxidoreductase n=1 Tax=Sulfuricurvum sp. TaxID=2025608 RepID=UPI00261FFD7B|nr:SDR family oxidoreductase [Sulfuricurvum sp.]MDD2780476.1 SDR family NAD(P)-dependent oxidoreductase [Sulfuricurvum sp.]